MSEEPIDKPTPRTPCPQCKAYAGHAVDCPIMTVEEKAEKMMYYYEAWRNRCNDQNTLYLRIKEQMHLWQGKHAILRHENNKLRRALYRQEKKAKKDKECSPSENP